MSDTEQVFIEKVEHLRTMRELRDTIEQMRREVKSEVGKLSGLRFTSYKDAIEWLTAHNALLDSFRGLCADINHERVSERKAPQ